MRYLVTGANRGIGLEIVKQLLDRGDEVFATARTPSTLTEHLPNHPRLHALPLDVASPASCKALSTTLADASLDVLISNAGVYGAEGGLGDINYDVMRDNFEVNALGPLRVLEATLDPLRRAHTRKVVHVSTQMASIADNTSGGSYAYRASKAALNMITRSAAQDLRDEGFTVFAIHPGWVQTDMGGPAAPLDVQTSARSMLAIIDAAAPDSHNGAFYSWRGTPLPW